MRSFDLLLKTLLTGFTGPEPIIGLKGLKTRMKVEFRLTIFSLYGGVVSVSYR